MGVNINVLTLVALTSGTKDPKILLDTSEFVPKTFYVGCGTRSTYVRASREAYLNRLEYAGWRARERRDGQRVRAVVLDSIIVLSKIKEPACRHFCLQTPGRLSHNTKLPANLLRLLLRCVVSCSFCLIIVEQARRQ